MQTAQIQPATLGIDVSASPEYVDPRRGQILQNLITGRDGKLIMRGPLTKAFNVNKSPLYIFSYIAHDNLLLARANVSGSDTFLQLDLAAETVTSLGAGYTNDLPALVSKPVRHGPATYYVGPGVGRYNPFAGNFPVAVGYAPYSPTAVASHLGRLFVLGGTVPGTGSGGSANPLALYWTDASTNSAVLGDSLADWQDDVSLLVNQIILDGDKSDPGVGLAKLGANLAILRKRSLFMLYGSTPASFAVRAVARSGCSDARSIVEVDDAIYWMSPEGYMRYDGAALENVSRRIWPQIATGHIYCSATRAGTEHLLLSINGLGYIFHMPTQSWSTLSIDPALDTATPDPVNLTWLNHAGSPGLVGRTSDYPFLHIGGQIWKADSVVSPEIASQPVSGVTRHIFSTGQGTPPGSPPQIWGVDGPSASPTGNRPIPATLRSRAIRLATPTLSSQLHRLFVDYSFYGVGVSGEHAWTVELFDGHGNLLQSLGELPAATDATRQRVSFDTFVEATELAVGLRWSGSSEPAADTAGKLATPEIYDVWVEYAPTRQQRAVS